MFNMKLPASGLVVLLIIVLLGVGTLSSCIRGNASANPTPPRQRTDAEVAPDSPTTQGKRYRCESRNYDVGELTGEERDIPDYRECYRLQERLTMAAHKGDIAAMNAALAKGAHPEGTAYQYFPALIAASMSGHVEAVRLMLDRGANINRVSGIDSTALNSAASEGRVEVVKLLLERGADVCYMGPGQTAEEIARIRGFTEVADLLKAAKPGGCK